MHSAKEGFSDSVWNRRHDGHVMSKGLFAFMVSLWTAVGIAVSAIAANYSTTWQFSSGWTMLGFVLGVLVISIAGIFISLMSDNPVISFVGYMMVTIPFGLLLGPIVALYTAASIVKVFTVTTGIVVVFGLVGALTPDNLEGWGSYLFGGLLILLLGSFLVPIAGFFGLPIQGAMTLLDWVGVILFTGYVIYDWNRAMRVDRTIDNSIDCAVALYLDFANLFIRLLSIMGDTSDD